MVHAGIVSSPATSRSLKEFQKTTLHGSALCLDKRVSIVAYCRLSRIELLPGFLTSAHTVADRFFCETTTTSTVKGATKGPMGQHLLTLCLEQ